MSDIESNTKPVEGRKESEDGFKSLATGAKVEYELEADPKNPEKKVAVNVTGVDGTDCEAKAKGKGKGKGKENSSGKKENEKKTNEKKTEKKTEKGKGKKGEGKKGKGKKSSEDEEEE